MGLIISNGTGGGNYNAGPSWNGGSVPLSTDNIQILSGDTITMAQDESIAGILIDVSDGTTGESNGTLDLAGFSLNNSSTTVINGTLITGISGGTGLTTAGFTANIGSTFDINLNGILNNSGDFIVHDSAIWGLAVRGIYNQTSGTGDWYSPNTDNRFAQVTIDSGANVTLTGDTYLSNQGASLCTINGAIDLDVYELTLGSSNGGTFDFGASSDIIGQAASIFTTFIRYGCNYTNANTGTFSFEGTVHVNVGGVNRLIISGDWSNANMTVNQPLSAGLVHHFAVGTLKIKDFILTSAATNEIAITNDADTDLIISGNIDLNAGAGNYITTWTKGTGSITLTGNTETGFDTTQTLEFDNQTLEDLIINANGFTKQLTDHAGIFDSITITAGTLDTQTFSIESIGFTDISGILIMDISATPPSTGVNPGLTTNGFTSNSGSTVDLDEDSDIYNASDFIIHDSEIWANNTRGKYTQTGSGDMANPNNRNMFYEFTINELDGASAPITVTTTDAVQSTSVFSNAFTNNGIINISISNLFFMRGSATSVITFGVNSDFIDVGTLYCEMIYGATFTNNKSGIFGITGTVRSPIVNTDKMLITGRFDNAEYYIWKSTSAGFTGIFEAGDLYCNDFSVNSNTTFDMDINCSTNNPSFYISGNIDLNGDTGSYTTIWDKGTGVINLVTGVTATTKTLDFNGQLLEDLVVNSSDDTDIKQLSANAGTFDTITVTDGKFDISTYSIESTGLTNITSLLTMGNSSASIETGVNPGLTTGGLSFNSGATFSKQNASIIYNSGDYFCANEPIATANYRGYYTQVGTGNYESRSVSNVWRRFKVDVGCTLTMNANGNNFVTYASSDQTVIDGELIINLNVNLYFGGSSTGLFNISATGEISGAGNLVLVYDKSSTMTNDGVISFTGTVSNAALSNDLMIPAWDFSTCSRIYFRGHSAGSVDRYLGAGTFICQDLEVETFVGRTTNIILNTNNPDLEISGNINLNTGLGVTTWTKGTNTITLTGSSETGFDTTQTLDFNSQTLEDLVINATGFTKQLIAHAGIFDSITITAGTLDTQTFSIESIGLTDVSDTLMMGVSINPSATGVDPGLTTVGLIFNSGSSTDLQTASVVNNSSDYSCHNSAIFLNNNSGIYTQTDDGDYENANSAENLWDSFTLPLGKTITLTDNSYVTNQDSTAVSLLGIVATDGNTFSHGVKATGDITYGSSFDITGAGVLRVIVVDGATITNDSGELSLTGSVVNRAAGPNSLALTFNMPNASYSIVGGSSALDFKFINGTLTCIDFAIINNNNGTINIDNSTDSPNFVINGDVDFNSGAGTYGTTYAKGFGTWILYGTGTTGAENIFDTDNGTESGNLVVEDITVESNSIYDFLSSFESDIFVNNGKTIVDHNNTNTVKDPSGAGEWETKNAGNITTVYYKGSNLFTGILDEVIFVVLTYALEPVIEFPGGISLDNIMGIFGSNASPAGEYAPEGSVVYDISPTKSDAYFKRSSSDTDWDLFSLIQQSPDNTGIPVYNNTTKRLETDTGFTYDSTNKALSIRSTQVLYVPEQTDLQNSLIVGDGGTNLSHSTGVEGRHNTIFGISAGRSMTTGNTNTFIGSLCGQDLLTGDANTWIGFNAGNNCLTSGSVFIGYQSGLNAAGSNNMFLGSNAGLNATGSSVVAIGISAGRESQGSSSVFIGANAGRYETVANKLFIDSLDRSTEAESRIESLIYGEFNATASSQIFRINGKTQVGINVINPLSGMEINHSLAGRYVTVTSDYDLGSGTNGDYVFIYIDASGTGNDITVTLPTLASSVKRVYYIQRVDDSVNNVTIDGATAENINGQASFTIVEQYDSYTVHNKSTEWSKF